MELIIENQYSGKTTKLIKMSAADGYHIVCHTLFMCNYTLELARNLGLDIPLPITFDDFVNERYRGNRGFKGFLIDDADALLQSISRLPIRAITMTEGGIPLRPEEKRMSQPTLINKNAKRHFW